MTSSASQLAAILRKASGGLDPITDRAALQNLQQLNLDMLCRIQNFDDLGPYLAPLVNLQSLSAQGLKLASLRGLPPLPNLKKLKLSDNRISGGLEVLASSTTKLKSLLLSNNLIASLDALQPLKSLPLVNLDLGECPVTKTPRYRDTMFQLIPTLEFLDGVHKSGVADKEYISSSDEEDEEEEAQPPDDGGEYFGEEEEEEEEEEDEVSDDDDLREEDFRDRDEDGAEESTDEEEDEGSNRRKSKPTTRRRTRDRNLPVLLEIERQTSAENPIFQQIITFSNLIHDKSGGVADLMKAINPEDYSHRLFYVLGNIKKQTSGVIAYCLIREDPDKTEILQLFTLQRFRGRGIGRHFVDNVIKLTEERGVDRVEAIVVDPHVQKNFYCKFWFFQPLKSKSSTQQIPTLNTSTTVTTTSTGVETAPVPVNNGTTPSFETVFDDSKDRIRLLISSKRQKLHR